MAEQQEGSSPLFAIFILAIYSLLLIPTTIYRLCSAAGSEDVVKPWEAVSPFNLTCSPVKVSSALALQLLCTSAVGGTNRLLQGALHLLHQRRWRSFSAARLAGRAGLHNLFIEPTWPCFLA